MNAGYPDGFYLLWDDSVHLREYMARGCCCRRLFHGSVAMLFEHQVGVHPDCQQLCRLFVKSDEAVSYLDFGGDFGLEVLLVASPACQ